MGSKVEKFKCSKCGETSEYTAYGSINVTLNPELKSRVLEKSLFYQQCPKCETIYQVLYPVVYHDMEKRFMFYFTHPSLLPQVIEVVKKVNDRKIPGYQYRIMIDLNELSEKIMIFDSGFNDNIMELAKIRFLKLYNKEEEKGDFVYFFNNGKEMRFDVLKNGEYVSSLNFPKDIYDEVYEEEYDLIKDRDIFVSNHQWALNYLEDREIENKKLTDSF